MATAGPNSPSTEAQVIGGIAWASYTNSKAADSGYDIVTINGLDCDNFYSDIIEVTNFGFSIPAGSTINGIKVEVKCWSDDNGFGNVAQDWNASILKGGTEVGNKAVGLGLPASNSYMTYGTGTTDLWGTTWTVSDINGSTFGFHFQVQNALCDVFPQINVNAYVDHIRITVYYTAAATAKRSTLTLMGVG